jgi:DNA-binding NarL/FixJ family response regulator
LLVDDHELFRKGIAPLLETTWDICGEAANGKEAVQKVRELKPDLVLLDLGMPVMGGTAAAREIRSIAPEIKILFLSMHESETIEQLGRRAHPLQIQAQINLDSLLAWRVAITLQFTPSGSRR